MDEYEKIEQPNGDILLKKKNGRMPKQGEVWIDRDGLHCVIITDDGGFTILGPSLVGIHCVSIEWNSKWKRLGMFDEVYELKE